MINSGVAGTAALTSTTVPAIGATPAGGVNRPALGAHDRAARELLASLGRARGFSVFQDEAANLFLRRAGTDDRDARGTLRHGHHLLLCTVASLGVRDKACRATSQHDRARDREVDHQAGAVGGGYAGYTLRRAVRVERIAFGWPAQAIDIGQRQL